MVMFWIRKTQFSGVQGYIKKSDSAKVLKLYQNLTLFSLGNIQEEAWQTQNKGLSYYRLYTNLI